MKAICAGSALLLSLASLPHSPTLAAPKQKGPNFSEPEFFPGGVTASFHFATGDFNNDGNLDIVMAHRSGSVSILLGGGDGTFSTPTSYSTGDKTLAVAVGDFNRDGAQDLAVANQRLYPNGEAVILIGNGDGSFELTERLSGHSRTSHVAVGDLNEDGIEDLVVTILFNGLAVYTGRGDGSFGNERFYPAPQDSGSSRSGLLVDLDSDGHLDHVHADLMEGNVGVRRGVGDGTLGPVAYFAAGEDPFAVTAGDFDGDAVPDLAAPNAETEDVSIFSGRGDGTFRRARSIGIGDQPRSVAAGDFDGDGRTDLAAANFGSSDLDILLGRGNGSFSRIRTIPGIPFPVWIVAADFNNDGRLDLAADVGGPTGIMILLNETPRP